MREREREREREGERLRNSEWEMIDQISNRNVHKRKCFHYSGKQGQSDRHSSRKHYLKLGEICVILIIFLIGINYIS